MKKEIQHIDIKTLEEAGLTNTEAKIYLMLLEQGSSLAGTITRNTGIHRRSVYDAIERLIQKGLVSYIKTNNRKYFEAVNPKRLIEIIKKKEEDILELMPKLELLEKLSEDRKETLFFRGISALKSVFDDQLDVGEEVLAMGDFFNAHEIMGPYFARFDRIRKEKKIKVRMIFDKCAKKEKLLKKLPLIDVRFVNKNYASPSCFMIYGNRLTIIDWQRKVAILIKHIDISNQLRSYFEFLWNIGEK